MSQCLSEVAASSCSRQRSISPTPGKNTSTVGGAVPLATEPGALFTNARPCSSMALSTVRLRGSSLRGGRWCVSTGYDLPSLVTTAASGRRLRRSPRSRVADIRSSRRSGRRTAWTSRTKARPRSLSRPRSWNSSKITQLTPGSSGLTCSRRRKRPAVTTSRRVRLLRCCSWRTA